MSKILLLFLIAGAALGLGVKYFFYPDIAVPYFVFGFTGAALAKSLHVRIFKK